MFVNIVDISSFTPNEGDRLHQSLIPLPTLPQTYIKKNMSHEITVSCSPEADPSPGQLRCNAPPVNAEAGAGIGHYRSHRNTSTRALSPWYFPISSPLSVFADSAPITRFGIDIGVLVYSLFY